MRVSERAVVYSTPAYHRITDDKRSTGEPTRKTMLWTILVVLIVLWALGFGFNVAGGLVHLLLVVALVVLILQLLSGRRAP
mgnify:CR=1 FL=1